MAAPPRPRRCLLQVPAKEVALWRTPPRFVKKELCCGNDDKSQKCSRNFYSINFYVAVPKSIVFLDCRDNDGLEVVSNSQIHQYFCQMASIQFASCCFMACQCRHTVGQLWGNRTISLSLPKRMPNRAWSSPRHFASDASRFTASSCRMACDAMNKTPRVSPKHQRQQGTTCCWQSLLCLQSNVLLVP